MTTTANGTFDVKNWDEKPYNEMENVPKLTHAIMTQEYRGDIEGEGIIDYLMVYASDSAATFVGLERIVGRIGDRSGSFVLQHTGTFADGVASDERSELLFRSARLGNRRPRRPPWTGQLFHRPCAASPLRSRLQLRVTHRNS